MESQFSNILVSFDFTVFFVLLYSNTRQQNKYVERRLIRNQHKNVIRNVKIIC